MPEGACSQFDSNGRKINQGQDSDDKDDLFTLEDDEFGSPYEDNLCIGDLDQLYHEEDSEEQVEV